MAARGVTADYVAKLVADVAKVPAEKRSDTPIDLKFIKPHFERLNKLENERVEAAKMAAQSKTLESLEPLVRNLHAVTQASMELCREISKQREQQAKKRPISSTDDPEKGVRARAKRAVDFFSTTGTTLAVIASSATFSDGSSSPKSSPRKRKASGATGDERKKKRSRPSASPSS
jgi:hypothetical protein